MSVIGPGTNDWNFGGDPYTLSLVTTLAVCLGGGLRSQSAFLVSTVTPLVIYCSGGRASCLEISEVCWLLPCMADTHVKWICVWMGECEAIIVKHFEWPSLVCKCNPLFICSQPINPDIIQENTMRQSGHLEVLFLYLSYLVTIHVISAATIKKWNTRGKSCDLCRFS